MYFWPKKETKVSLTKQYKFNKKKYEESRLWVKSEEYSRTQSTFKIDSSFINFDEVKLLTIAKIDKRISEVQEEFDRL